VKQTEGKQSAMLAWPLLLLVGCGASDRARVRGTAVHRDGSPLEGARVIARDAATGKSANGTTSADGNYELDATKPGEGLLPGEYTVIVVEDTGDSNVSKPRTISTKYTDPGKSGLKFSAKAGQSVVFDMTLDPP
jgi:hypothetical protein